VGAKILRKGRRQRIQLLAQALRKLDEREQREAAAAARFMPKFVGKF